MEILKIIFKIIENQRKSMQSHWKMGIGDPEMRIEGCFMVSGGGPRSSKIAAARRAKATGRGRGGEGSVDPKER